MSTAGIVVIGNEVLSGKVEEENARFLIRELRALGVELMRVAIIRDELGEIAREIKAMSEAYDYVFSTGGVGPTHDDVTMEGVALGLGVPLVRSAELEATICGHFGARVTASVLHMADVPEGTELLGQGTMLHPITRVRNIYVLPGVPEFLRAKFNFIKAGLADRPIVLRQVWVRVGEDAVGDHLREVLAAVPGLEIGSYPRFDTPEFKVKITIEAKDAALVDRGVAELLRRVPAGDVVRVE